jgi:GNAT superfamily N-acetyltransferase
MQLNIRALQAADRVACAELFLAVRRSAFHWLDGRQFRLDDFEDATVGESTWLAEVGSNLVGFVSVYPSANFVHHLFVYPAYQNKGIGAALLRYALERIGRPAELKCLSKNTRACAFYKLQGWREVDRGSDELGEYIRYRKRS